LPARRIFVLILVILVAGTVYYYLTTDHNNGLTLIGTVDANQVIVSSNIQGRIEKLLVDEGTDVKAGDPIAVIDSSELNAEKEAAEATLVSLRSKLAQSQSMLKSTSGTTSSAVNNAQAMVQSTEAQLAEAQANLERQKLDTKRAVDLTNQGVESQQARDLAVASLKQAQAQVDSLQKQVTAAQAQLKSAEAQTHQATAAQSDVASAKAQADSAQAQIAEIEARLGYTRIYAPVTGTVDVRAAREGEVVAPGQPIVVIVDYNDTWVRAAMPETYNNRVAVGDVLPIVLPSGEKTTGKVIFKNVESDFATQRDVSRRKRDIKTIGLKLKVDNSNRTLVPGITADVIIPDNFKAGEKVAEKQ